MSEKPILNEKRDCVYFMQPYYKNSCSALIETVCRTKRCKFYKPKEEVNENDDDSANNSRT